MLKKPLKKNEAKFISVFTISVFIFLFLIFLLAVITDPHNDFGTNIFKPLVMTNRTEKLKALETASEKPKILIFGSSRMFSMDPELIENIAGKKAYNASVSWARPEEHFAMLSYLINDVKIKPDLIIVGINLAELNNDKIDLQTINNKKLNKYLPISVKQKVYSIIRSFKNSINLIYLRDIAVSLFNLDIKWDYTKERTNFLQNGKIMNIKADDKITFKNKNNYQLAYSFFKDVESINLMRKLYLENFIAIASQNNIKIKLILLPMPPSVVERLREETPYSKLYNHFRQYIDELRTAYRFEFYDFSEITKFGGMKDDFIDSTHSGPRNINKITDLIFSSSYAVQ